MAGMEGGVGGPPQSWKSFFVVMGCLAAVMIGLITLGEYLGFLH